MAAFADLQVLLVLIFQVDSIINWKAGIFLKVTVDFTVRKLGRFEYY